MAKKSSREDETKKAVRKVKKAAKTVKKAEKRFGKPIVITVSILLVAAIVAGCFFYDRQTHKISDFFKNMFTSRPGLELVGEGEMRIHFVDVGQGDSIIIQLPDGKNMLIDGTDQSESQKNLLLNYIDNLQIKVFDYCMLTHTDADHCGSLNDVIEREDIDVKTFYVPGVSNEIITTRVYQSFLNAVENECKTVEGAEVIVSESGMSFGNLDKGYMFYLVLPDAELRSKVKASNAFAINAVSPIMFLKFGDKTVCFTGDSNKNNEPLFVEKIKTLDVTGDGSAEPLSFYDCDILKVAHHGSETSSLQEFLDVVKPEYSVIQVGEGNKHGHPRAEALSRLESTVNSNGGMGSEILRNDLDGDVVFTLENDAGKTSVSHTVSKKRNETSSQQSSNSASFGGTKVNFGDLSLGGTPANAGTASAEGLTAAFLERLADRDRRLLLASAALRAPAFAIAAA